MPSEPPVVPNDDRAGTGAPAAGDDRVTPGPVPAAIDTVFAPQDGLSGFIPQVIREHGEEAADPPAT